MSRDDVVECVRLGGLEITRSRAEAWSRGKQGGALERGARRSSPMTEAQFDAFTAGLIPWARGAYDRDATTSQQDLPRSD